MSKATGVSAGGSVFTMLDDIPVFPGGQDGLAVTHPDPLPNSWGKTEFYTPGGRDFANGPHLLSPYDGVQGLINPTPDRIGGGPGYTQAPLRADADHIVNSEAELITAVGNATTNQLIWIDSSFTMTSVDDIALNGLNGLIIASDHKSLICSGTMTTPYDGIIKANSRVRFSGISFINLAGDAAHTCLRINDPDCEVDNCYFNGWTHAAAYVRDPTALNFYFHHNTVVNGDLDPAHTQPAYAVALFTDSTALIEANYCHGLRHLVVTDGTHGVSYECRYNVYANISGTRQNAVFDTHPTDSPGAERWGGDQFYIHHNQVELTEEQSNVTGVLFRGLPQSGAWVRDNDFNTPFQKGGNDYSHTIRVYPDGFDGDGGDSNLWAPDITPYVRFEESNNRFDQRNYSQQKAPCDGVQLEGAGTNIVANPSDFTGWVHGIRTLVEANYGPCPVDGVVCQRIYDATAGNRTYFWRYDDNKPTDGGDFVAQVIAKADTEAKFKIIHSTGYANFDVGTGITELFGNTCVKTAIEPLSDGWYLCTAWFELVANAAGMSLAIAPNNTAHWDDNYDGDGRGLLFALVDIRDSSRVRDSLVTDFATRDATAFSVPFTAMPDIPDAGVRNNFCFQVVIDMSGTVAEIGDDKHAIVVHDGSAGGNNQDNVLRFYIRNQDRFRCFARRGGVSGTVTDNAGQTDTDYADIRLRYTVAEGIRYWVNGKLASRSSENADFPVPLQFITLGSNADGANNLSGVYKNVRFVPRALSDAEVLAWNAPFISWTIDTFRADGSEGADIASYTVSYGKTSETTLTEVVLGNDVDRWELPQVDCDGGATMWRLRVKSTDTGGRDSQWSGWKYMK